MQRMRELIYEVKKAHPRDRFFSSLDLTLRSSSQARALYRAYDRALSSLDSASWRELMQKAVAHFRDHRKGQLKQGFFNQLNEAFAYQYLVRQGYRKVAILREDGKTIPDIIYFTATSKRFCEVKTIGISESEIARRSVDQSFDGTIYQELSEGFLRKLDANLKQAQQQIDSHGSDGLIFVVAQFDDFTMLYYEQYRLQLLSFLHEHSAQEVFVKVGLIGGRRIYKPRNSQ